MVVEHDSFIKETVGDVKLVSWVELKLKELCQKYSVVVPEESVWQYGSVDIGKTIFCQREFGGQAVGFILSLYEGEVLATTVFLDLYDKFVLVRKRKYKKDYFLEIPLK